MTATKKFDSQMAVRKVLERAVAICGSYERLAKAAGSMNKWTLLRLYRAGKVKPHQAVAIERATGKAVNRLEFFPTLIRGNPKAVETVQMMSIIRVKAIRDGDSLASAGSG